MINKSDIADREMETIEDFFQHVITNGENGNWGHVKQFIKKMSKDQKMEFLEWMNRHPILSNKDKMKDILIELAYNPD